MSVPLRAVLVGVDYDSCQYSIRLLLIANIGYVAFLNTDIFSLTLTGGIIAPKVYNFASIQINKKTQADPPRVFF